MPHGGQNGYDEKQPLVATPRGCCNGAFLARVVTSVTALAEGYDIGCISGALVLLREDWGLSSWQVGVLMGSIYFAIALGAPLSSAVADAVGRKIALGATYVILVVSNLMMALSQGYAMLLAGRVLMGVGMGAGLCVVTAYVTEVSPKSMRARFVCLEELFLISGITAGYCFNYLLEGHRHNWRLMFGLGALPAAVAFGLLFLPRLPESPRWMLLKEEHRGSAEATLASVVGKDEARQMLLEWEQQDHQRVASWGEVLCPKTQSVRNSMVAGLGLMVAQLATGISIIALYLGHILSAEMSHRHAFFCSALLGCLRVVALAVTIFFLLDHVGRRPLLLLSTQVMTVCMGTLACLYAADEPHFVLKLLALGGFGVGHALGLGPATYVYVAEVLDTPVRSKGISIGLGVGRVFTGLAMTFFPLMEDAIGIDGIFAALFCIDVLAVLFVYYVVPETKNVSLETLHKVFEGPLLLSPRRM